MSNFEYSERCHLILAGPCVRGMGAQIFTTLKIILFLQTSAFKSADCRLHPVKVAKNYLFTAEMGVHDLVLEGLPYIRGAFFIV